MDLYDFFFRQVVTQGQMDWAFDRVQAGMHGLALDNGLVGILEGLDVQQHAPMPNKTVDIIGPGVAYDQEGQRIAVPDALSVVDCATDEFGMNTNPPTLTFQRYISIFARFKRNLTEPALDGNNITVWTKQLESFEFVVRIGAEAAPGGAVPAPLMADAVLFADILVTHGFTAILNADIDLSRRQDWVRFAGTVIGDRVYGTAAEGIADLLSLIDGWGGGLPFSFTQQWVGPVPVAGPTPPVTTIQEALNAIVYDLAAFSGAARSGSAAHVTAGNYCDIANGALQTALNAICDAVAGHIGGAAPQHPATSITFTELPYLYNWFGHGADVQAAINTIASQLQSTTPTQYGGWFISQEPIAGSPESIAPPAPSAVRRVSEILAEFLGHINDRTERATREMIPASWTMNAPQIRTRPHAITDERWASKRLYSTGSSQPYAEFQGGLPYGGQLLMPLGTELSQITDGYDPATGRPILLAVSGDYAGIWACDPTDYAASAPWTQHPITALAIPHDIVQVGAYIYVLGRKSSTGSQAYVWQIDAANWTYGPSFGGASGLTLTSVTLDTSAPLRDRIVAAQIAGPADRLVVVSTVEDGTGNPLTSIDPTTGTFISGVGSMTAGVGQYPDKGAVAVWKDLIFFAWHDTIGGVSYVGVAEAAGLTAGMRYGAHAWHNHVPVGAHCTDICCDGLNVWFVTEAGELYAANMIVAAVAAVADADVWSHEATVQGPAGASGDLVHLAFDGLRLWIEYPETFTNRHIVVSWSPDQVKLGSPAYAITPTRHYLNYPVCPGFTIPVTVSGRMVVSGDALYVIQDEAARYLARLTQLGLRQ